ncbi:MAG TPA: hypothetical protein VGG72_01875 [Bryobacteraceae bacterium]|jgi:hypothetical protein
MAAKKMFPPGEVQNLFGDDYEEFKLKIGFRIQAGQVVMQFSDHVERVRMGSGGARKLAAMLILKADELDRLGNAMRAASKPAGSGATPPKSRRKQPTE